MKINNSILYLFAIVFTISFTSCSDDSDTDTDTLEATNLIIGEWLVITEHDYFCGTDTVYNERFTDSNQTAIYSEDGTWQSYQNGVANDWTGTWEYLGDNEYSLYWGNDDVTQLNVIEFPDDNTMYIKYGGCYESQGESYETYTAWTRQ